MNQRIKIIRASLNLSQDDFCKKIKLSRSHISSIENGRKSITDRIVSDICREFNVNENWLRTGNGDIFIDKSTFDLDEYAKVQQLTPLEYDIIKGYLELDVNFRHKLMTHFKAIFQKHSDASDYVLSNQKENEINTQVENYRRELESAQKGETSSASRQVKGNLG